MFRKILTLILSLFIIFTTTFFLIKKIPGDPFTQEKALPKEVLDALYNHYHLNDPLSKQYFHYLFSSIKGDFGPSLIYQSRNVNEMIRDGFKVSCLLGIEAFILAIVLGISWGSIAAFFDTQWQAYVITIMIIFFLTIPPFIVGTLLQALFAVQLHWLPIAKWGSLSHTILPAFSLSLFPAASIARLLRVQMREILQKDFIKLARLKGLNTFEIFYKHALKNSFIPILGYLGHLLTSILTGSFLIEKIYGIPGLGNWFVSSVINRDYPVIMGITCFYGSILLCSLFVMDVFTMILDPRLRKEIAHVS